MAEDTERTDHPWSTLTTVTTFDQGSNMTSTICLNDNTESPSTSGQITQRVNPSSGILIKSLIKHICSTIERDKSCRNKLYYDLCDYLRQMQVIDSSFKLDYEMLNKHQNALYKLIKTVHSANGSESLLNIFSPHTTSRYRREFIEVSFIASGGFGEVYKAQHRLDGTDYAIKKISVTSSHANTLQQHLNEVKTLAKLNHTNIVSYKAAWIEVATIEMPPLVRSSFTESDHKSLTDYTEESELYSLQSTKDSYSNEPYFDKTEQDIDRKTAYKAGMHTCMKQQNRKCRKADDFLISQNINEKLEKLNLLTDIEERVVEEDCIAEYEESISDIVSFRNSKKSKNLYPIEDNTNHTANILREKSTSQEVCTYSTENSHYMILYIQMSLCEQTLDQWMRGRINATPEPMIKEILKQILCGIDYMHSQNVVHHDIKPRNIFISTSGQLQIQLGDFGLACPLKSQGKNHSACGTHMYAAPEQLQGKCDPKSDIYSMGIVLVELVIPTQTKMELSSITRALKNGYIPPSLPKERHKWAQMIIQMVQEDPVKRPWTKQLLQNLKEEDVTITKLKNTVVILENDIRNKNDTIQKLQETIELLKKELKGPVNDTE